MKSVRFEKFSFNHIVCRKHACTVFIVIHSNYNNPIQVYMYSPINEITSNGRDYMARVYKAVCVCV